MTLILKVTFFTVRPTDGVAVKVAEGEVNGTDYTDVITQCQAAATAMNCQFKFSDMP